MNCSSPHAPPNTACLTDASGRCVYCNREKKQTDADRAEILAAGDRSIAMLDRMTTRLLPSKLPSKLLN